MDENGGKKEVGDIFCIFVNKFDSENRMHHRLFYKVLLWVGLFFTILFLFFFAYHHTQQEYKGLLRALFDKAIHLDKDRRDIYPSFSFIDDSEDIKEDTVITLQTADREVKLQKSDSYQKLALSDRRYIIDQLALADLNPIHPPTLNSLYDSLLHQAHIPARTAIIYEYDGKKIYSSPDSAFYKSSYELEPVFIGIHEKNGFTLQAFIKLSRWYIGVQLFRNYKITGLIITVILFLLFCLIHLHKKEETISPIPEVTRDLIELDENLFFDLTHGTLIYQGNTLLLTGYKLKLFILLLEHRGNYLNSDFIKETLWPEGSTTKDALAQTVRRLRMDLEIIPVLHIVSGRNKGYCLNFQEPHP